LQSQKTCVLIAEGASVKVSDGGFCQIGSQLDFGYWLPFSGFD